MAGRSGTRKRRGRKARRGRAGGRKHDRLREGSLAAAPAQGKQNGIILRFRRTSQDGAAPPRRGEKSGTKSQAQGLTCHMKAPDCLHIIAPRPMYPVRGNKVPKL